VRHLLVGILGGGILTVDGATDAMLGDVAES